MRINILLRPQYMSIACSRQPLALPQHAQGHVNADEVITDATHGRHIHLQLPAGINRPSLIGTDRQGGRP